MASVMHDPKNFGKNLASLRKIRGWTQEELAARSGFQPSAISHYETGTREPMLTAIVKLARALNLTPNSLLGTAPVIPRLCAECKGTGVRWEPRPQGSPLREEQGDG